MRKLLIVLLITTFLLGFTSISVQASTGKSFSTWYKHTFQHYSEKAGALLVEKFKGLELTWHTEMEEIVDEISEDLDRFHWTSFHNSKKSIENYHKDYESRLLETKANLMDMDFTDFENEKKEAISREISEDVEGFLQELLK